MKRDDAGWRRDLADFTGAAPVRPPPELGAAIASRVRRDLNPPAWLVFAKLCLITVISGCGSLYLCPQFGLGLTRHNAVLMHFFHRIGPLACSVVCGAVFLGISGFAAAAALRAEEVRLIRRTSFLQIPILALLALSVFVCAGAEMLITTALLWWLGAVAAGTIGVRGGWAARRYLARHAGGLS